MKSITLSGTRRETGGKQAAHNLRLTGYVPCELYGKSGNTHFSVFSSDLKPLIFTADKFRISLTVDGEQYDALMREVQYHPLSDEVSHIDFFEIDDDKVVKIELPIQFTGNAAGVREGGKLVKKLRTIKLKGLPKYLPDAVKVDISSLGLGKSIKVRDIEQQEGLEILNSPSNPVASVEIPRALRGKTAEAAAPAKKK